MASTTSTQNGSHQWLRPFGYPALSRSCFLHKVPNGRSIDANRETGFDKKLLRAAVKELLKVGDLGIIFIYLSDSKQRASSILQQLEMELGLTSSR
ncbi:hypothetical protein C1H46_032899 [Malus baccata]|uniref:Uncharacterized protein n=1 Tax=Malus baccata TaxID=106549 RepID=A0A540L4Y0_MALBA|nr:hypothetical protein C1H46_032899 [Malus baccata]